MIAGLRLGFICSLLWAPVAVPVLAAQTVPSGTLRMGTLSFDGRATVGAFTGTTTTVTGAMQGGELNAVRGWVEFPVRTLSTGNGHRDRDMNKSMESGAYPVVRFELSGVTPPASAADSLVTLQGRFTIHGVTREATVPATVGVSPGAVHVHAETTINLKDYDIHGLTRMLGTLKMDEHVVVHIDLVFGPA
ncbi:MAG TPA: YceI family protein [Gemmatimonadales bacterium]|nr:YceI family protein [Gemmatimonadales bacterium]